MMSFPPELIFAEKTSQSETVLNSDFRQWDRGQWDRGTEGQTDRGIKGRLHSENVTTPTPRHPHYKAISAPTGIKLQ